MKQNNIRPENAPQSGVYRHYKGNLYQVFGMAQHSETEEWMVVYQALYGEYGFWLRPLSVWLEPVNIDPNESPVNTKQRFQLVTPAAESLTQLTKRNLM